MHLGLISAASPFRQWMYRSGPQRNKRSRHQFAMFTGKAADYPQTFMVFIVLIYWCVLSDEWQARRVYYSSFMRGRMRESDARAREIRVREGKAGDGQALPGSISNRRWWEMGTFHFVLHFHIAMPPRGFFQMGDLIKAMATQWKTFLLIRVERSY